MSVVSNRLVLITSFCLSTALCSAEPTAPAASAMLHHRPQTVSVMPTVAPATPNNVETATGTPSKLDAAVLNATVTNQAAVPSEVLKPQAVAPVAAAPQGFRAKAMDKLRGLWGACKGKSAAALGYAGSALSSAASAQANIRAKAIEKLRGLWGACKGKSAAALGYAGSALSSAASAQANIRAKAIEKLRGLWGAYKAASAKELGRAALGCARSALQYGYKGFKFAIGIPYEINALLYSQLLPKPLVALLLYPLFTGLCPSISLFSEAFKLLGFSAESIYLLYQGLSTAYWHLGFTEYFYELMKELWSNYSHVEWAKLPGKVISSVVYTALILIFGMSVIHNVEGVWMLRNVFYVQLADIFGFYAEAAPTAAPTADACSEALKFFKSSLDHLKNTSIKIDSVQDQGAIKKAFKFLSRFFHPDKGGSQEDFIKLHDAFESLKSAECLKFAQPGAAV